MRQRNKIIIRRLENLHKHITLQSVEDYKDDEHRHQCGAYMRSGRYRWIMAQNASPLFHDDVMLVIATSR